MARRRLLTGWGRSIASEADVYANADPGLIAELITRPGPPLLARGQGRSYGDAALNAGGRIVLATGLTSIGPVSSEGVVTVGAGVTLDALLERVVPDGWFMPVTPGIRQVSIGGALAVDVHGKNHSAHGSFGAYVESIDLIDGVGQRRQLVPGDELFAATLGGMGLTGVVVSATVHLRPIETTALLVHTDRTSDLDSTIAVLDQDDGLDYRVAWLDCLSEGSSFGRGVVTRARHAGLPDTGGLTSDTLDRRPEALLSAPRWAPRRLLGHRRVRAFNAAYFLAARRAPAEQLQPLDTFFYPLESIDGWNRLYGREGFVQYQCVVPTVADLREILRVLQRGRVPAFLAVLKKMGTQGPGLIGFPAPGWSLAVDLPADPALGTALDELDAIVAERGGRVYLAKDSRLAPHHMQTMYPDLNRWREIRASADPHGRFTSDLARRLHL